MDTNHVPHTSADPTRLDQRLLRYIDYARWLSRTRYLSGTGWVLPYHGTTIYLENLCDFLTVRDLISGDHYQSLREAAVPGSVFWDIGMNVGSVSLMFGQMPNVTRVYGYEPMAHTYSCALKSFAASAAVSNKIEAINFGVGGGDREIQVPYSAKIKSSIGMSDIDPFLKMVCGAKDRDFAPEPLRMKDASQILRDIRARHPDAGILLKIDAEGAEYEIIGRLYDSGLLQEISAAVIEWHGDPGPSGMVTQLQATGFQTSIHDLEPRIGLVKASRSPNPLAARQT